MLVRSKMTHDVITAPSDTTLAAARDITRQHRIRHLPIVDDGVMVGIISDRDLTLAMPPVWATEDADLIRELHTRTVGEHMIRNVITVAPTEPVEDAAQLLYTHRIGCLPVVDDGRLVGIISETDLLRAYAELFGIQRNAVRIEVKMEDRPGELARVVRLIGIEMRANIVGMVVPPIEEGHSVAIMHVQVSSPNAIVDALRKLGYQVGSPSIDLASPPAAQAQKPRPFGTPLLAARERARIL